MGVIGAECDGGGDLPFLGAQVHGIATALAVYRFVVYKYGVRALFDADETEGTAFVHGGYEFGGVHHPAASRLYSFRRYGRALARDAYVETEPFLLLVRFASRHVFVVDAGDCGGS